jgi:hypothetical protein
VCLFVCCVTNGVSSVFVCALCDRWGFVCVCVCICVV